MVTTLIIRKRVPNKNQENRFHFKPLDTFKFTNGIFVLKGFHIKSESQFCKFLYDYYGKGFFSCLAWKVGHKNIISYWKGIIDKNGFTRDLFNSDWIEQEDNIPDFRKQLSKSDFDNDDDYYDEIQILENDWIGKTKKRYGSSLKGPFNLQKSSPSGVKYQYEKYKKERGLMGEPAFTKNTIDESKDSQPDYRLW